MMCARGASNRVGRVALFGVQIAVGLVAAVMGYVQLINAGSTGLTDLVWMLIGMANVVAGLYLLSPNKGLVGAALLVATTVVGATANIATFVQHRDGRDKLVARTSPAAADHPIIVRTTKRWDI